jgi:nicotinamide-nucleotide amidase
MAVQQEMKNDLAGIVKDALLEKNETIAVAESVTAGMLQTTFAAASEATKFFQGGITAYNLGQKYRHLGVEPIHAQSCNCVSDKVAATMAKNVCKLFESDWGIGITGYVVPDESTGETFAYFAIAYKDDVLMADKVISTEDNPADTNNFYCTAILQALVQHLKGK